VTAEILNRDLPAILGNVNRITDDVSDTTTRVRKEITQLSSAGDKVADMVDQLSGVESQLKHSVIEPLSDMLTTLSASTRALNVFIRTLRSG
jgi:ABC-type transporter Mla subunit MlaD